MKTRKKINRSTSRVHTRAIGLKLSESEYFLVSKLADHQNLTVPAYIHVLVKLKCGEFMEALKLCAIQEAEEERGKGANAMAEAEALIAAAEGNPVLSFDPDVAPGEGSPRPDENEEHHPNDAVGVPNIVNNDGVYPVPENNGVPILGVPFEVGV